MKTIDVTPTWSGWLRASYMILRDCQEDKRHEVFKTLQPEFEEMAKLADAMVAEQSKIPLSDEELNDVFITAFEGGSNYWYFLPDETVECLRTYKKDGMSLSECVVPALNDGCVLKINDVENPEYELGTLTKSRFGSAFRQMEEDERDELYCFKDESFDAGDADVIFQYLVLGEVTFG